MPARTRLLAIPAAAVVAAVLAVGLLAGPTTAAPAPKVGGACAKAGERVRVKGVELVCVGKGRKKVWRVAQGTGASSGSSSTSGADGGSSATAGLPDLATLAANRSDVLPIDISQAYSVAPFLGARSHMPHKGMHVNFAGLGPFATQLDPTAYPAVRAVSDGVVTAVEPLRQMGSHQAYGLNLAIGHEGREDITLNYSLEPFVMEPSSGFYSRFITVKQGQRVKKGDVLGYLYVPPGLTSGTHLHFHMNVGQAMGAPTIFTPGAVAQLRTRFGEPGGIVDGAQLPACIGYKVDATENPLGTGAVDCLN